MELLRIVTPGGKFYPTEVPLSTLTSERKLPDAPPRSMTRCQCPGVGTGILQGELVLWPPKYLKLPPLR